MIRALCRSPFASSAYSTDAYSSSAKRAIRSAVTRYGNPLITITRVIVARRYAQVGVGSELVSSNIKY